LEDKRQITNKRSQIQKTSRMKKKANQYSFGGPPYCVQRKKKKGRALCILGSVCQTPLKERNRSKGALPLKTTPWCRKKKREKTLPKGRVFSHHTRHPVPLGTKRNPGKKVQVPNNDENPQEWGKRHHSTTPLQKPRFHNRAEVDRRGEKRTPDGEHRFGPQNENLRTVPRQENAVC